MQNASWSVLYTSFLCYWMVVPSVGSEGGLYTYTGVGLSVLLVLTYRAMRRPIDRGTSDKTGSTFLFYVYSSMANISCQQGAVDVVK